MTTRVVVLAAGHGKRMNHELPKVLVPLNGRPMISYLLDSIKKSGLDARPVIVVSQDNESKVREVAGAQCDYVIQTERLGTGHAVKTTRAVLEGKADNIIVLYGDHPLVKPGTILKLAEMHAKNSGPLSMLTIQVPDFNEWRTPFHDFGRVIRNAQGAIIKIVEKKDASENELEIKEVNPSFFAFKTDWLWTNLDKLDNNNSQKEYYLTDLVRFAMDGGYPIATVNADPLESIGVNTPEHLELAQNLARKPSF